MNRDQFRRIVELAVGYHDEAETCASVGAYHAGCVMIASALEAALLATAAACEDDLCKRGLWPTHSGKKRLPEQLRLADLCKLGERAGWLSMRGEGAPRDLNDSDVGDAIEFVRWLRNLAVHPGRHVREDPQLKLSEPVYRNAYGVVRAVFDQTYAVIQGLD